MHFQRLRKVGWFVKTEQGLALRVECFIVRGFFGDPS
jgi:hypothetical protein